MCVSRHEVRQRAQAIFSAVACGALLLLAAPTTKSDDFSPDRYGIGAMLVQPEDSTYIEIRQSTPNGPAARAGLEVGDRIVELDGKPIRDWSFHQVMDYLIRSEPLPLRLTVRRGENLVSVELVRMRISDIAAEQGLRWVPEGGSYRGVPLHARPEMDIGDVVPLDSLLNPACRTGTVHPSKKATVLYFWTTWCAPCKVLTKELRGMTMYHRLVAINIDRSCEDFKSAIAVDDPPGEEFWAGGWYGPLSQSLGVYRRGVPTAALLDPDGRLIRIATGVEPIKAMIYAEPPADLKPLFLRAAVEFGVPADVLMAVAHESFWSRHGEPSPMTGECGMMALQSRGDKPTPLELASKLVALPADSVCSNVEANIRGAAAVLAREFVQVHGVEGAANKMLDVENWRAVLPHYTRFHSEGVNEIFYERFSKCLAARGFGGS